MRAARWERFFATSTLTRECDESAARRPGRTDLRTVDRGACDSEQRRRREDEMALCLRVRQHGGGPQVATRLRPEPVLRLPSARRRATASAVAASQRDGATLRQAPGPAPVASE